MSAPSQTAAEYAHTLYHNDLSALPLGPLCFGAQGVPADWSAPRSTSGAECPFRVLARGTGQYIETSASTGGEQLLLAGSDAWRNVRVRAVMTPLDFDGAPVAGGVCGIVARYRDSRNFLALVLDADGQVRLLLRREGVTEVLAAKPLEFCLGQSLSLSITVDGSRITGVAGPYAGPTRVEAVADLPLGGRVGFISDVRARFGPFTVEYNDDELARLEKSPPRLAARRVPALKLERTVPLNGLANCSTLLLTDLNGDGRPEILAAQASPAMARTARVTRLTCLTALDLDGRVLWQAGVPDSNASWNSGPVPVCIHDLYGTVVACVFGYDVQIRDARTGRVLFSGATPSTLPVGSDFKGVTSAFGAPWGDESLNMDVAWLGFCDTQGNGSRRELLLKDDYHHLAVLDVLATPPLQTLFQHRGNHGHTPWVGDVDNDGKDEILAGYHLVDGTGRARWSLPLGGCPSAVDAPELRGADAMRTAVIAAGTEGMALVALPGGKETHTIPLGPVHALCSGHFRGPDAGVQIVTASHLGGGSRVQMLDACGRRLWLREFPIQNAQPRAVRWTDGAPLLLLGLSAGGGLVDCNGDLVATVPADAPSAASAVCSDYAGKGRDALLAWDAQRLSIYIPDA